MNFKDRYNLKAVTVAQYELEQKSSSFWSYDETPKFMPIFLHFEEREGRFFLWKICIAYGDPFAVENEDKDEITFSSRKLENVIKMAEDYLVVRPLKSA